MADTQSFKNHAMFDPPFHFFLAPVGLVLLICSIVAVQVRVRNPEFVLTKCCGCSPLVFKTRLYALKVQDRVIRLEERLRLAAILPVSLQPRICGLKHRSTDRLALRADAELPGLMEKALGGNWNRKQIKETIKNWRADTWRV